jgi:hypothetical protein
MNRFPIPAARAPFLSLGVALVATGLLLPGCGSSSAGGGAREIRARIAAMRDAILAERPEGIVQFATPDWTFHAPDGRAYDRAAYLERTGKFFRDIEIESLQTAVLSIDVARERAEVQLKQTLVRVETDAAGVRARWRVTYRETQEWVHSSRGWLVARVRVYLPERVPLSPS